MSARSRSSGDVDVTDLRRNARQPELALERAFEADTLFDELGDHRTVVAQLLLELGLLADQSEKEFNSALDASIESIFRASMT